MTDTKPTSAAAAMRALFRKLMEERVRQQIALSEMARRIGITRQSMTAWETGKAWPSIEHLFRWAKLLGYWVVLEPICDAGLEVEPRLSQGGGLLEFFSNPKPDPASAAAYEMLQESKRLISDALAIPPEMLSAGPPLHDLGPHIAEMKAKEAAHKALADAVFAKPKRQRKPK